MKNKLLMISLLFFFCNILYAEKVNISPCQPSAAGNFCIINSKMAPKGKFKYYAYCGQEVVAISKRQRAALDAYLRENQNMVLRFSVDNEFIDGPCF